MCPESSTSRRPLWMAVATLCLAGAGLHGRASAQSEDRRVEARTVLVQPSGDDAELTARLARVVRARLEEIDAAGEIERSPLEWRDLQLAAGCTGEERDCYAEVAARLDADDLVVVRTESSPTDVVVELVRSSPTGVARALLHERGVDAERAVVHGIAPALRELYDLPEAPADLPPPRPRAELRGPVVLGAVSIAALAGAIGLAVASDASGVAWRTGSTATMHDVDLALDARQRAELEAIGADLLFASAGILATTAVVWMVSELTQGEAQVELVQGRLTTRWSL
jgi:hypothetical protein